MDHWETTHISSFCLAGINYKKTDASIRGQFAINNDQYEQLIALAPSFGIKEFFVLSTCNRTEIYGFAGNSANLSALLCSQTNGTLADFDEMCYKRSGIAAIEHLFNVAAGLDSQILGDYEIIGQLKQSAKFSKQRNFIGAYLERIINDALKASKKVRTTTLLSGGTVSVSFAAVQYIKAKFNNPASKKILLLGTGKIGSNICKNFADYLPGSPVVLVNRSMEKACELASAFGFRYDTIDNMKRCINEADIILVATNAGEPLITAGDLENQAEKLIIDLSVPCNVAESAGQLENITLINIDELSRIKDETLLKRSAEIPKVKKIIAAQLTEFTEWHEMRKHVPLLKNVKDKLLAIQSRRIFDPTIAGCCDDYKLSGEKIQKVINGMAVKMRARHQPGCHYIEAINDFISTAATQ